MIKSLHKLGFGFVEIGTLMPEEQEAIEGHKPKMILLNDEEAIISYHVNEVSKGHADVIPKLRALRHRYEYEGIFGINLGVNRYSDFVNDSATGMKMCSKNANYLVININPPENLPQVILKKDIKNFIDFYLILSSKKTFTRLLLKYMKYVNFSMKMHRDQSFLSYHPILSQMNSKKSCQ